MLNVTDTQKNPARIVMVEDNRADVYLLRHALNQHEEEYELEVLHDGAEAIRFVERERNNPGEPNPCVIVLDLHLPKQDGCTVLEAIRQDQVLAHVHVVALTSLASPSEEFRVQALGVRLYRTKPIGLEDWIELAGEILAICRETTVTV